MAGKLRPRWKRDLSLTRGRKEDTWRYKRPASKKEKGEPEAHPFWHSLENQGSLYSENLFKPKDILLPIVSPQRGQLIIGWAPRILLRGIP